ncbi:MAG: hypothetical protein Q8927_07125 [Bacteroidota bacterium]|nr:hypothetical protein [Bacteroidota bacterium]MDP4215957.1 hypothetical protein [Bacteroidota bacterium]MDP4253796.1 hypothetical protein [Bacteroidota bacterium]
MTPGTISPMYDPFNIPVNYKGKELEFEARLQSVGYTHRFLVNVEGTELVFERDEDSQYRAIIPHDHRGKEPDKALLQAIALAIQTL